MNIFIIGFAPDDHQPMNYYWDGSTQMGIDTSETPDTAQIFTSKAVARSVAGRLQQIYTDQIVGIIPGNLVVTPHFSDKADLLAPAAAPASASSPAPASASGSAPAPPAS